MHNGLLTIDNEKMSKSLGNFFTIREVLEALRRRDDPLLHAPCALPQPVQLQRREPRRRAQCAAPPLHRARRGPRRGAPVDWSEPRAAAFCAAMNDDFNTPIAVSVLFELAAEVNRGGNPADATLLKGLGATLGLLQQAPRAYLQTGAAIDVASIERLIEERRAAKGRGAAADRACAPSAFSSAACRATRAVDLAARSNSTATASGVLKSSSIASWKRARVRLASSRSAASAGAHRFERGVQPRQRAARIVEVRVAIVERAAVVRAQDEEAHDLGVVAASSTSRMVKKLPSDFDIFSSSTLHEAVVHPVRSTNGLPVAPSRSARSRSRDAGTAGPCRRRGCRSARRAARTHIAEHSMCQPGRPSPQRRLATRARRAWRASTARSRADRRFAVVDLDALAGAQVVERLAGELAVAREAAHRVVHVAVARRGRRALVARACRSCRSSAARTRWRAARGRAAATPSAAQSSCIAAMKRVGQRVDRLAVLARAADDLVVDVGDVAHVGHVDSRARAASAAPCRTRPSCARGRGGSSRRRSCRRRTCAPGRARSARRARLHAPACCRCADVIETRKTSVRVTEAVDRIGAQAATQAVGKRLIMHLGLQSSQYKRLPPRCVSGVPRPVAASSVLATWHHQARRSTGPAWPSHC